MKKHLCQYAIVRFLPYLETGEFANVGIVLMCPETGYFDFRLMTHIRRITAFFEELDAGIYRRARADFQKELKRIQALLAPEDGNRGFADVELAVRSNSSKSSGLKSRLWSCPCATVV